MNWRGLKIKGKPFVFRIGRFLLGIRHCGDRGQPPRCRIQAGRNAKGCCERQRKVKSGKPAVQAIFARGKIPL